jgi:hypothetical protein
MVGVVFVVRVRIAISIQSRLGDGRPLVLAAFRPPAAFAAAATTAPTSRTAFFVQLSGLGRRLAATSIAALLVNIRSFDVRRPLIREFEFLVTRFAGEIGALFPIERLAARRVVSPAVLAGSARRSAARFAAAGFAARFGIAPPATPATTATAWAFVFALLARRRLGRIRGRDGGNVLLFKALEIVE